MSDPPRLLRTQLDQLSRRAIDAASSYEPPLDAKARVWQSLSVALPASTSAVLGATATSSAATISTAAATGAGQAAVAVTATVVTKAVAIGLGIGLAVNAAIFVPRMVSRTPVPATTAAADAIPAGVRGPVTGGSTASLAAAALVRETPPGLDVPQAPVETTRNQGQSSEPAHGNDRSTLSPPIARTTSDQSSYADTLREESRLLMRARQALNASDGEQALKLVAEHRRHFANGALTQECDALEVQALAKVGRTTEARKRARAFLNRFPASPHNEKVRAIAEMPTDAR